MAEFCMQCSEDHFGFDDGGLAGLTTPEQFAAGTAALVICEGCGLIQVDPQGRCLSTDCLCKGQEGHGWEYWEKLEKDCAGKPKATSPWGCWDVASDDWIAGDDGRLAAYANKSDAIDFARNERSRAGVIVANMVSPYAHAQFLMKDGVSTRVDP